MPCLYLANEKAAVQCLLFCCEKHYKQRTGFN